MARGLLDGDAMRIALLPALSLALMACTGASVDEPLAEDVEARQQAIVGGTTDSGDPSVVLVLVDYPSHREVCSGTVIGQKAVLTAAHCFLQGTVNGVQVGFAASYSFSSLQTVTLEPVADWIVNPAYDASAPLGGHDSALIELSSPAGVPAIPYHAGAPDSSWVGRLTRLIGYGRTSPGANNDGTRRVVTTQLGGFDAADHQFVSGQQNCTGDSGGPALQTINGVETIIGIGSAATANCTTRGYYSRVDTDIAFINAQLNAIGSGGLSGGGGGSGGVQMGGGGCAYVGPARGTGIALRLIVLFAVLFALRRRRA